MNLDFCNCACACNFRNSRAPFRDPTTRLQHTLLFLFISDISMDRKHIHHLLHRIRSDSATRTPPKERIQGILLKNKN